MNIESIKSVTAQAEVKPVLLKYGRNKGRWGFVRIHEEWVERSTKLFPSEQAALAAAHSFYELRAA